MSNLFCSSIGKKLVMSITGLFLIMFLVFHASMNVVAIISTEGYDAVCEFLGANWYALVGTLILAAGFLIHIIFSMVITIKNQKARGPERYASVGRAKEVSWAGKNMFVLGIVVLGFIGLHLWQFWAKMQLVEIMGGDQVVLGGMVL
ncbi:MAG: succinate dehydrogenase/fumarate reductase cytochrome b subunit, partial [Mucinivorans sp.]